MRRKLTTFTHAGKTTTVYKDSEWGEYVVKLKGAPRADYHTDDKADATVTARRMVGLNGLGSSGKEHRAKARDKVKAARWWLRTAHREAKAGRCTVALASLTTAHRMAAATAEHREAGGASQKIRRKRRGLYPAATLTAANRHFTRYCLKKEE